MRPFKRFQRFIRVIILAFPQPVLFRIGLVQEDDFAHLWKLAASFSSVTASGLPFLSRHGNIFAEMKYRRSNGEDVYILLQYVH